VVTVLEEGAADPPGLAPYRTLKRQPEHLREGIFVAEGPTVVERLLRSPLEVVSVLATGAWLERLAPAFGARRAPAVYQATDALLERITGFAYHQGVMAVGRVPPEPDLDALLAAARAPVTLVALDGLTSAENTGVLVRAASALGAAAVIAGNGAASPFLRRAVRTSMGGAFYTPVVHAADLAGLLRRLARDHGVRACAAALQGAVPLTAYRFPERSCVVLGHEYDGVSPDVLAACDDRVVIPMAGHLDSLNVQTAGAVFLFEAGRQRAAGGGG